MRKFFVFALFTAAILSRSHQSLADTQALFNCPHNVQTHSLTPEKLTTSFQANEIDVENYACSMERLWHKGLIEDRRFFSFVPAEIDRIASHREDIKVYILRKTATLPLRNYDNRAYAGRLADIYTHPDSRFYDPEKSETLYTRAFIDFLIYNQEPSKCTASLNRLSKAHKTPIPQQVLARLISWCTAEPAELITLARNYEAGKNGFNQDAFIAFKLYEKIRLSDLRQSDEKLYEDALQQYDRLKAQFPLSP